MSGPAVALTIAGSDSGGGAGVQADLKTFAALEVYGLSAITALTAQSTTEVRGILPVPPEFVAKQIDTVVDDFGVQFAKVGMLGSVSTIAEVARSIERRGLSVVLDPVMIAETGAALLSADAVSTLLDVLVPRAELVTPNLPEIRALTGVVPLTVDECVDAAKLLRSKGARAVLVKGGHAAGDPVDVLVDHRGEVRLFAATRVPTRSTHGTGCTYAAAITAFRSRGLDLCGAVGCAHRYLQAAIRAAPQNPALGKGHGPVHHFHAFYDWPS